MNRPEVVESVGEPLAQSHRVVLDTGCFDVPVRLVSILAGFRKSVMLDSLRRLIQLPLPLASVCIG